NLYAPMADHKTKLAKFRSSLNSYSGAAHGTATSSAGATAAVQVAGSGQPQVSDSNLSAGTLCIMCHSNPKKKGTYEKKQCNDFCSLACLILYHGISVGEPKMCKNCHKQPATLGMTGDGRINEDYCDWQCAFAAMTTDKPFEGKSA